MYLILTGINISHMTRLVCDKKLTLIIPYIIQVLGQYMLQYIQFKLQYSISKLQYRCVSVYLCNIPDFNTNFRLISIFICTLGRRRGSPLARLGRRATSSRRQKLVICPSGLQLLHTGPPAFCSNTTQQKCDSRWPSVELCENDWKWLILRLCLRTRTRVSAPERSSRGLAWPYI